MNNAYIAWSIMVERAEEIYQALMDAGISEEELSKELKEKDIEFQGFMTKQAILYLIAKDHGINIDSKEDAEMLKYISEDLIDYNDFAIPISKVSENMRNIVISGRLTDIFQAKDFVRKDGSPGKVGSFQICDQSECVTIVLWDDHTKVMENELFQVNEVVQIVGGYTKKGRDDKLEVHLGRKGNIILAPENVKLPQAIEIEGVESPKEAQKKKGSKKCSKWTVKDLHEKEGFVRFISGTVQKEIFKEMTLKNGEKSFLFKFVLSDDTSAIKVNIWGIPAVELFKNISDGDCVKISNTMIKLNSYTNEREITFTKNSQLEII